MKYFLRKYNVIVFIFSLVLVLTFFHLFSGKDINKELKASGEQIETGYYIGNGERLEISGLGFAPNFVLIKSDTAITAAVFKTSVMPTETLAYTSATVDNNDNRLVLTSDGFIVSELDKLSLNANGFTVRNSANLNLTNIRYTYIAFGGSDCTSSGYFCVGTYTGNVATNQAIDTGFSPDLVIVKRSTAVAAHFKTRDMPANTSLYLAPVVANTASAMIASLDSTGFTAGATDNVAGGSYYFIAFRNKAGFLNTGTYAGDGIMDRYVSGVGFKPNFVVVKNGTNATTGNVSPFMNLTESYGNHSSYIGVATANLVNMIKSLEDDGFTLGTDVKVNAASNTYYWFSFAGASLPSSSGNYKMASGTYTGSGVVREIEGLGFKPDLVIIKDSGARLATFRTSLMAGDSSAVFASATANQEGAIISMDDDGFALGTNTLVNLDGATYHWQAFGNAWNPVTRTGASDFAIGAVSGSLTDNRNVTRLPFKPDLLVYKSINTAGAGVMRTSLHVGDTTSYFSSTADAADLIQAISDDGFQLGASTVVNSSAIVHFWFAFKQGDYFKVSEYNGDGIVDREIKDLGISPRLLWVKSSSGYSAVSRSTSISSSSTLSQFFTATADTDNMIKSFTSEGFTVGALDHVNRGTGTPLYRYMIWYAPVIDLSPSDLAAPTGINFTEKTTTSLFINWDSVSGATSYEVERAVDIQGNPGVFYNFGTTSELSLLNTRMGPNSTYWYRIRAVNSSEKGPFSTPVSVTTEKQTLKIQTGSYVGNGKDLTISNLGFSPEFLIIKSDTANTAATFRTTSMPAQTFSFFGAFSDNTPANINIENISYTYIAYAGSDCSATGEFCLGMYHGTGTSSRAIPTGFQPDLVIVNRASAIAGNFRTASMSANESIIFGTTARTTNGTLIRTLDSGGSFTVGTNNDYVGLPYFFMAFKEKAGFLKQGLYTGNGATEQEITGVGFKPNFVFARNRTSTTTGRNNPFFNVSESHGNSSSYMASATANLVNAFNRLTNDGFVLGNSTTAYLNYSGDQYVYVAFGGGVDPVGKGTYRLASGVYTGNGITHTVSNIGFAPDLVIIKDSASNLGVFRTKLMAGDQSAYLASATANVDGAIQSFGDNSFTVGSNVSVNTNNNTYYWQAFGNAYDPIDNTGSVDFQIGAYYGNGLTNRVIGRLLFSPDLVVVKAVTNRIATFRTSLHTGDLSSQFSATVDPTNFITGIGSNDFTVGTGTSVNTAGVLYHWFSFKQGNNFKIGEYNGNGSNNRVIDAPNLQPDLIWIKSSAAYAAVSRNNQIPSGNDVSQFFTASSNNTNRIKSLTTTGFTLGTADEVNRATGTPLYRYMVWKIPAFLLSITVSDGVVEYETLPLGGSKTTLASDMPSLGDEQTVTNNGSVVVDLKIKGVNTSSSCIWNLSGTNGFNQYKHQFCNSSNSDCSSPPTHYSNLTTNYQSLDTGIAALGTSKFHLRLTMPTGTSCNDQQNVNVTVLATEQ